MNRSSFLSTVLSRVSLLSAAIALALSGQANASGLFDADEILNPEDFALIAAPVGQTNRRQLLIVEQLVPTPACWDESADTPTAMQPLLLSFDFSGVCGRMSDSNAYSVRIGDQDFGLQYALRVRERDEGAVLMAVPLRRNSGLPELEIGRSYGVQDGFIKLYLDSAWRLARRSYQGQRLGHVYLMSDYSIDELSLLSGSAGVTEAAATEAPLDVPDFGMTGSDMPERLPDLDVQE